MMSAAHKLKIGAHLSTAGGIWKAPARAADIGANALQIFSTSPRGWKFPNISDEDASRFKSEARTHSIEPVYFHASYLINLADAGRTGNLSVKMLIAELSIAAKLGIRGSVVHLGSFKNGNAGEPDPKVWATLIANIKDVIAKMPENVFFIAENAGTRKIAQSLDELARIVKEVNSSRLKVCLDTCHLFSAGYDISNEKGLDNFLKEFDTKIGLGRLELIHTNDSRDPFASMRDRHENIGEGTLGKKTFQLLLNHPKLLQLPFILEVPGFDDEGPDKKNVDMMRGFVR